MASAQPPVIRHMQDTDVDCGRACAQMVIASRRQAGAPPHTPIVSQRTLQEAELQPWDIQGWWFTEPGELRHLLMAHTDTSWRVVSKADPFEMLAEVHLAVLPPGEGGGGAPSIFTEGASDHWVVAFESLPYQQGWLFRTYNPATPSVGMYEAISGRTFAGHSYIDTCSTANFDGDPSTADGEWVLLAGGIGGTPEKIAQRLGAIDFRIEDVAPPRAAEIVPRLVGRRPGGGVPPSALAPVPEKGYCVAVVEGGADRDLIGAVAGGLRAAAAASTIGLQQIVDPAGAVLRGAEAALLDVGLATGDARLASLLHAGDRTTRARLVRNLDNAAQAFDSYVLVGFESQALGAGLVAVYDARTPVQLLHYLLTTDVRLVLQLDQFPGEDLWWTRRPTGLEPPLRRHFYPFRRVQTGVGLFQITRLIDGVSTAFR